MPALIRRKSFFMEWGRGGKKEKKKNEERRRKRQWGEGILSDY
jgi:hypothetical protein